MQIFIVNHSGHRYKNALDLAPGATFVNLTEGSVNPTLVDRLAYEMAEILVTSSPEDFLLLSGTPVLNALASSLWMVRHRKMNLLVWDSRKDNYMLAIVTADNFEDVFNLHAEKAASEAQSTINL